MGLLTPDAVALIAATPLGVLLVYSDGKLRRPGAGVTPDNFHDRASAFAWANYLVLQHPTLKDYRFWAL